MTTGFISMGARVYRLQVEGDGAECYRGREPPGCGVSALGDSSGLVMGTAWLPIVTVTVLSPSVQLIMRPGYLAFG